MPYIITITNRKGGVGKSTLSAGIAQMLANQDLRVLLVDLDSQSNLAMIFGVDANPSGTLNWLEGMGLNPTEVNVPPGRIGAPVLHSFHLLDGIPRAPSIQTSTLAERAEKLGYDVVVFDCPPTEGVLSISALAIAHDVVIPVEADTLSTSAALAILAGVDLSRQRATIVLNKNQARTMDKIFANTVLKGDSYRGVKIHSVRADEVLRTKCSEGAGIPAIGRASSDIWEVVKWNIKGMKA
jgi:chromosome partitioning protein